MSNQTIHISKCKKYTANIEKHTMQTELYEFVLKMYGTQILKKKTFDMPKTVLGNAHQHTGFYVFKILYALIFDDTFLIGL